MFILKYTALWAHMKKYINSTGNYYALYYIRHHHKVSSKSTALWTVTSKIWNSLMCFLICFETCDDVSWQISFSLFSKKEPFVWVFSSSLNSCYRSVNTLHHLVSILGSTVDSLSKKTMDYFWSSKYLFIV